MITHSAELGRPALAGSAAARAERRAVPRDQERPPGAERAGTGTRGALRDSAASGRKRAFDVALAVALGLALAVPMLLIACAVRLSSPGPVLYGQRRIGRHGRHFRTWKFRTMAAGADLALERLLAGDERLRAEWERDHKLRDDPRVTRVGRFLRRTSLDELPQLWNVLKGEMSFVGPRPIVDAEVPKYGAAFALYTRVRPGITGLWQVSGRNGTTYERRVELDRHYVLHASPRLDRAVLLRTPGAVLRGEGASRSGRPEALPGAAQGAEQPVPARDARGRALRVLLVTEASSAGVGRHVIDLARGLGERGHDVHLVYSPRRIDRPFEQGLAALPARATHEVSMHRAPHPGDLAAWLRLRRTLARHGPFDVVHAHSSKAGLVVRALPLPGRPSVVYTPHCIYTQNPDLSRPARALARGVELALARRSDALIAVSPDEGEHVVALGVDRVRVRVVPNGVHPVVGERAAARRALELADDDLVIGFVGRLCAQKDPALLLRACAALRADRPRLRLVVTGDGPLAGGLRRAASELGLAGVVRWTGHLPAAEVMPAFDLFALTSRYEGLPYVLLEATACGLPIVATRVGGVPLVVEDGVNGSVVAVGDRAGLGAALARLADDPALRSRMARAASERAPRFSVATMVTRTEDLYRELLDRSAPARRP